MWLTLILFVVLFALAFWGSATDTDIASHRE